eukprot:1157471-Pelagomonas_calceolata.AAC.12
MPLYSYERTAYELMGGTRPGRLRNFLVTEPPRTVKFRPSGMELLKASLLLACFSRHYADPSCYRATSPSITQSRHVLIQKAQIWGFCCPAAVLFVVTRLSAKCCRPTWARHLLSAGAHHKRCNEHRNPRIAGWHGCSQGAAVGTGVPKEQLFDCVSVILSYQDQAKYMACNWPNQIDVCLLGKGCRHQQA